MTKRKSEIHFRQDLFPSLFPHQATWKVCLCYTFILLTTSLKIKRLIILLLNLSYHCLLQFLVLNVVWLVFLFFMVLIQEVSSMKIWFVLSFWFSVFIVRGVDPLILFYQLLFFLIFYISYLISRMLWIPILKWILLIKIIWNVVLNFLHWNHSLFSLISSQPSTQS